MNPILDELASLHESIPFDKISVEDYLPALRTLLDKAFVNFEAIKGNSDPPNFSNTLEALESLFIDLHTVMNIYYGTYLNCATESMQACGQDLFPLISEFESKVYSDDIIFDRLQTLYLRRTELDLTREQATLLEKSYRNFKRGGAGLAAEQKQRLEEIEQELWQLQMKFGDNYRKATESYELLVSDRARLAGLPADCLRQAAEKATEKGHDGSWIFDVSGSVYDTFMRFCADRELRRQMYIGIQCINYNSPDFDNQTLVHSILRLRREQAEVLGYPSFAHLELEERMLKSPEKAMAFLDELDTIVLPAAHGDIEALEELQEEMTGVREILRWDYLYYSERLRERLLRFNKETLRPYFELESLLEKLLRMIHKLYGIEFIRRTDLPTYHPDVRIYDCVDASDNRSLGRVYLDLFKRKEKQSGAWCSRFIGGYHFAERASRPHVALSYNLTRAPEGKATLLEFDEVEILLHELGHALHNLCGESAYPSLAGSSVALDFVELPSQLLENWVNEPGGLDLLASHHESGEAIPRELQRALQQSKCFMKGSMYKLRLEYSRLDLKLHLQDPSLIGDLHEFDARHFTEDAIVGGPYYGSFSCSFAHVFNGAYAAGYYSYLWAELLEADAFDVFRQQGIFDQATADRFRRSILATGGSEEPMTLYRRFREREPSGAALLRRAGLQSPQEQEAQ